MVIKLRNSPDPKWIPRTKDLPIRSPPLCETQKGGPMNGMSYKDVPRPAEDRGRCLDLAPWTSDTAMWSGSAIKAKTKMIGDNWNQKGDLLMPSMLTISSPATGVTRLHVDTEGAQGHRSRSARQKLGNCPGLQRTGGK
ncbi:hypothetical protein STEG23_032907 [Scotinomys teguina]